MSEDPLSELRDQIDAIDNELIALLIRRANIVGEVAEVKGKQPLYIRPGREAIMLRNLLEKDTGKLSKNLIHRLWREMIGAFTLQEGQLRVAVPEGEQGFWDLARDHFGSFTPLLPYESNAAALHAVFNGETEAAALPLPQESKDVWWRHMLDDAAEATHIFYRFPFDGQRNNARSDAHDGVVVGVLAPENTGHDVTLICVEWKKDLPKPAGVKAAEGLPKKNLLHVFGEDAGQPPCSYIKLEGFLRANDDDLKNWLAAHKDIILRARVIGSYPMPYAA